MDLFCEFLNASRYYNVDLPALPAIGKIIKLEFLMRKTMVVGNWKMNGSRQNNEALLEALIPYFDSLNILEVGVAICPPLPYLEQVGKRLQGTNISLGAQTLNAHEAGPHTGEVCAEMLTDLGCQCVLIGHSERRSLYGESDAVVTAKFETAKANGLMPILCVGETLEERHQGETESVVARQLRAVINTLGIEVFEGSAIAYEPVWAIGTGETATPAQAQAVHAYIRGILAEQSPDIANDLSLLYGGSVKVDNASELFAQSDVDGGLIGGASLNANAFAQICLAAAI
ncbi:triose-phosphate isomerase [Halomonas sp. HG01]|uniref:triose-phosphate isomerase n=1 Tax=Halomonas sp. HG01 TaxID=1609967 RepID=UPI00301AD9DE